MSDLLFIGKKIEKAHRTLQTISEDFGRQSERAIMALERIGDALVAIHNTRQQERFEQDGRERETL